MQWNPACWRRWSLLALLLTLVGQLGAESGEPFGQGLLFRIERPGLPPSHVFGTMHSDDERVVQLPGPVRQVFEASEAVVLEMEMGEAATLTALSSMVYADGRELRSVIGDALYRQTAEAMVARGVPEVAIRHYKPWAVMVMLSMPPPTTGQFLDMLLYQWAMTQGKRVHGLESAQEQVAVFDGFSEVEQIQMLQDALKDQPRLPEMFRELVGFYLARDLAALLALNTQHGPEDVALAQRVQVRLVERRNRLMVERMLPLLEEGRAFVAVGALHLPGEDGILALLVRQGCRVERVY
jgi:uncharacterized protein YbaP (TraB family)